METTRSKELIGRMEMSPASRGVILCLLYVDVNGEPVTATDYHSVRTTSVHSIGLNNDEADHRRIRDG